MAAAALSVGALVALKTNYVALGIGLSVAAVTVGAYVDQTYTYPAIFGNDRKEQPKLIDLPIQTAAEGSPAARCLGRYNRVAPHLMYATDPPYSRASGGGSGTFGKRGEPVTQTFYGDVVLGLCWNEIQRVQRLFIDGKTVFTQLDDFDFTFPVDNTTGASGTVRVSVTRPNLVNFPTFTEVRDWFIDIEENVQGSTALGNVLSQDRVDVFVDNTTSGGNRNGRSLIRRNTAMFSGLVTYGIIPADVIATGSWRVTEAGVGTTGWRVRVAIAAGPFEPCYASQGSNTLTRAQLGDPFNGDTGTTDIITGTSLRLFSDERRLQWKPDVLNEQGAVTATYEESLGAINQDVNVLAHTLRTGTTPVAGARDLERYPGIAHFAVQGLQLTNFGNRYPSFTAELVQSETIGPAAALNVFMLEAGIPRESVNVDDLLDDVATGRLWGNELTDIAIYIPTGTEVPQDNDVVYVGNRTPGRRYFVRRAQQTAAGNYALTLDRPLGIPGINAPGLAVATELLRDTQTLYGLTWAGMAEPIRQVQTLRTAYFLDSAEYDGVVRIYRDDARQTYALTQEQLDARETNERPGRVLDIRPVAPDQIPDRVDVTYLDVANSNLQGTEHDTADSVRGVDTEQLRTLQFDLPGFAATTSLAKAISRKLLQAARERRFAVRGRLPRTDHLMQEGDEATVTVAGVGYRIKIDEINIGANGAVEFEGTALTLDRRVIDPPGVSSRDGGDLLESDSPGVTSATPVAFQIVDALPSWPERHFVPGFYVAACRLYQLDFAASWAGAAVYESRDSGGTWDLVGGVGAEAIMGSTTDATGVTQSFADWDATDASSTITVELLNGSLATVTQAEFDDNQQLALVGSEVIAFRDVTQNADGTYTISELRRGVGGSPTTHTADVEPFVLLEQETLTFLPIRFADVNVTKDYAVTNARLDPTEGNAMSLAIQAWNARPVPPTGITADRSSGTNIAISWTRASRVGDVAHDYATVVPDLEHDITYDVVLSNGREFLGETSEAVTYSADQIAADGFDIEADTIDITVYQVDASIGRGRGWTITSTP